MLILYCGIIAPFIIIPGRDGVEFLFNGRFVWEKKTIFNQSNDFMPNLSEGNNFSALIFYTAVKSLMEFGTFLACGFYSH